MTPIPTYTSFRFMEGGGELGELIRNYNWASTSIGPPDQWPQSLRTTLSIVLNSRFPMFLWWGPDMIQFYNDAYRPSLGIEGKHPTAVGQKGEDCWPEIWPIIKPLTDQVWAGESTWNEDMLVPIYRNGRIEDMYWTFSYSPVKDETGKVGGILVVCHETTEKRVQERTAEIKSANFNLQRSNAELEQFAYITSHDLQEPLRKIRTFTEMLEASLGSISSKSKGYLDKIAASSTRMRKLIKDILHYSRLIAPNETFTRVDLHAVIWQVVDDFELMIREKNAKINIQQLPVIEANPLQINQLFSNLISNALKFNTGDEPVIDVTVTMLDKDAQLPEGLNPSLSYCLIEFRDNGIGFDQQYAEQIFTIFQRLHTKHEYAGTGIGLALCRKIVLNHHGSINAYSENGEGATFRITLPLKQLQL